MKLFTAIATAAVITCCLGNEMPAKAQTSDYMSAHEEKVWDNGYVFGYEYGVLTTTCVHYHLGHLSRYELKNAARRAAREPDHISKPILNMFRDIDQEASKACLPTIEEVYRLEQAPAENNNVLRTTYGI